MFLFQYFPQYVHVSFVRKDTAMNRPSLMVERVDSYFRHRA